MVFFKNHIFDKLLLEYGLSQKLDFQARLPKEIQKIIEDKIVHNEFGVGLKSLFEPTKAPKWYEQSYYEDDNNHFHVDWYISSCNDKDVLILAVVTLRELASRFENAGISWVRFWLSFQTCKMSEKFAKDHWLHETWDEYYSSDRLSFFTKREWEEVVSSNFENSQSSAIFIIDI